MGQKTLIISMQLIDEETGKQQNLVSHESNDLSPLQVCDVQDIVAEGVLVPLRKLARAMAEAKADAQNV